LDDMSKIKAETATKIQDKKVLEAKDLGRVESVNPMDLDLHAGEVLGLAGLVGSGRSETAGLIFGLESPDSGTLQISGKNVKRFSPAN